LEDVEICGCKQGKKADGQHNSQKNVGDHIQNVVDSVDCSFELGVVPDTIHTLIHCPDSLGHLLDIADVADFDFDRICLNIFLPG